MHDLGRRSDFRSEIALPATSTDSPPCGARLCSIAVVLGHRMPFSPSLDSHDALVVVVARSISLVNRIPLAGARVVILALLGAGHLAIVVGREGR